MATQEALDRAYMECAFAIAELSYAQRKQVGAIIVALNGGIIAEGFNGTPSGFENRCEYCGDDSFLVTKPEVLHAESNAIMKVARSTHNSVGTTLYITVSPCFECAKLIIQAGIRRVVYVEEYRNTDGLELLHKAEIKIDKCSKSP